MNERKSLLALTAVLLALRLVLALALALLVLLRLLALQILVGEALIAVLRVSA
jgi:hypothetical protein